MAFKDQLIKLRKRKNITQIELANSIHVKQYVISSWETGRSEPNISQISLLADIFEVPTDYLLDKNIVRVDSENKMDNIIKQFEKDNEDDFLKCVNEICGSLSDEKKKKMLEFIKASADLIK